MGRTPQINVFERRCKRRRVESTGPTTGHPAGAQPGELLGDGSWGGDDGRRGRELLGRAGGKGRWNHLSVRKGGFALNLQVFDVGAVAASRFGSEDVDPDLRLTQILSPGLNAVWGVPGGPFALGVGGSFVPDAVDDGTELHSTLRAGVWFGADLVLF